MAVSQGRWKRSGREPEQHSSVNIDALRNSKKTRDAPATCSGGLTTQERRDVEKVFLDQIPPRRGAAVRIDALRSRMARMFRNRRCRSPFRVAARRAKWRTP